MKCPGCGAEIGDSKVCDFCGSRISVGMQKELEQLNKEGCPKCGSTNIEFKRENHGEVRGKSQKQIVHRTVGYCKDCGYTWYPEGQTVQMPKKRKTWLWVIGWIFCFPIPLTILMLRKRDMKPWLKYGIIAAAWLIYIGIGIAGAGSDAETTPEPDESAQEAQVDTSDEMSTDDATAIVLKSGEIGEYGTNETLDNEEVKEYIAYHVPPATYSVSNDGDNLAFIVVYKDGTQENEDGIIEQIMSDQLPVSIEAGDTGKVTVGEGEYIELNGDTTISLIAE